MKRKTTKLLFEKELRAVSVMAWVMRLLPIPADLLTASLIAQAVSQATQGNAKKVLFTAALLMGTVLVMEVITAAAKIWYETSAAKAVQNCRMILYRQFLSAGSAKLFLSRQGESMERLHTDFEKVTQKNLAVYPALWTGILRMTVYLGFLGYQNRWIALALAGISLIQVIPPLIVKKYMQENYGDCREIEAELTDFALESCRGMAAIKLYQLSGWLMERMQDIHRRYTKIGNMSIYTGSAESAMKELFDYVLKYGTYGIAGAFVLFGTVSMETGIEAIALSVGLFQAVKMIFSVIPDFAVTRTAQRNLESWFDTERKEWDMPQNSEICCKNVEFPWGKTERLDINGDSFTLIKGANGIGKSTLLEMITGLMIPEKGEITVGGCSAGSYADMTFPEKICYLAQNDPVLECSANELYEMVLKEKKQEAYVSAKDFNLDERMLGARLAELSGGERKKVYLSLAFAINPQMLLLDEPTNSLDEKSIQVLYEKLRQRKKGILMITHEPRFDGLADQICLLGEGIQVEEL